MFTKSIRWRFQFWLAFLLVCILSGFGVTAYQLYCKNQIEQIDHELQRRLGSLVQDSRPMRPSAKHDERNMDAFDNRGPMPFDGKKGREVPPPPMELWEFMPEPSLWLEPLLSPRRPDDGPGGRKVSLSPQTLSMFEESDPGGYYFAIWNRNGRLLNSSTNAPANLMMPDRPEGGVIKPMRMRESFRESYYFTGMDYCILVGRSMSASLATFRRFAWWLGAGGATILALGLGGGWWLVSRTIRPVTEIAATASRISAGNLSERIDVAEAENELGQLATVLNTTFARLEDAFAQQRQFIADAAHELRTPIAVLISEAQTTLARERGAGEYRETVEACLDTAQQMRRLTESLLALARFDAGQEPLQKREFDLAETTRECVNLIRPLASQQEIQIQCHLGSASIHGDPDRVGQVITNLLSNAVFYNRPQGTIQVRTYAHDKEGHIVVADTGKGISADDLPHLFTRFFRVDTARTVGSGRTGLGLAICKAIVDAHGGNIEVTSQPDKGTQFTVRLPHAA